MRVGRNVSTEVAHGTAWRARAQVFSRASGQYEFGLIKLDQSTFMNGGSTTFVARRDYEMLAAMHLSVQLKALLTCTDKGSAACLRITGSVFAWKNVSNCRCGTVAGTERNDCSSRSTYVVSVQPEAIAFMLASKRLAESLFRPLTASRNLPDKSCRSS